MRKILSIVLIVLALLGVGLWWVVRQIQGPPPQEGETALRFTEIELPFQHDGDLDTSLPFMALSAVDVDGDGVDEIFLGNGYQQEDGIFRFVDGAFQRMESTSADLAKGEEDATMGAASIDFDGDGLEELFAARESGVHVYRNLGEGRFEGEILDFGIDENTVPLPSPWGISTMMAWWICTSPMSAPPSRR